MFHSRQVVIERHKDTVTLTYSGDVQPTDKSLKLFRRKLERRDLAHGPIEPAPHLENRNRVGLLRFEANIRLSTEEFFEELLKFLRQECGCLKPLPANQATRPASKRRSRARLERRERERPLPRLTQPRPA